ncbi:MAG TPA: hypothetical protein VGT44_01335 [Ktedonobacteraceae bacterium]|nr:hypothetical protein [Ktedonobacteraceae bacterium]
MKKLFWITCLFVFIAPGISMDHQANYAVTSLHVQPMSISSHTSSGLSQRHFFAGFSVNDPATVYSAASVGLGEAQSYADAATVNNALGKAMLSTHMHQIDSTLWYYLYQYQCHQNLDSIAANYTDCEKVNPFPTVAALLRGVAAYLQQARNNSLIDAYWVLDDGTLWKPGGAKLLLQQIHRLIQQYSPGRPAICGFGAEFGYRHDDYWMASLAQNFSPQGCDMVGLYIYSAYLNPIRHPSPDQFDWKMTTILPKMFASLRKQGWNQSRQPLIGITQSFAGMESDRKSYLIVPSVLNMVTQALAFCQDGAIGVSFYAWDIGGEFLNPQTPMNNSQMAQGVKQSVAACTRYWQTH